MRTLPTICAQSCKVSRVSAHSAIGSTGHASFEDPIADHPRSAAIEDVDLAVGEREVQLDVANLRIAKHDIRRGTGTLLRLGLRVEHQDAVGGPGVSPLATDERTVGR